MEQVSEAKGNEELNVAHPSYGQAFPMSYAGQRTATGRLSGSGVDRSFRSSLSTKPGMLPGPGKSTK